MCCRLEKEKSQMKGEIDDLQAQVEYVKRNSVSLRRINALYPYLKYILKCNMWYQGS